MIWLAALLVALAPALWADDKDKPAAEKPKTPAEIAADVRRSPAQEPRRSSVRESLRPQDVWLPMKLLRHKSVQENLKLSEEQVKKLPEFRLNIYRKNALDGVPFDDEEVRQLAMREWSDTIEKELRLFLSGDQYKRLNQIGLQLSAEKRLGPRHSVSPVRRCQGTGPHAGTERSSCRHSQ